jgi:hypothetical protein
MKTQFNKASRTDGTLVTLNLAQFEKEFNFCREGYNTESHVFVNIDGHEVTFRVNRVRNGKAITAVTHCFPRYLRLPQIGRPVYADVTEVY